MEQIIGVNRCSQTRDDKMYSEILDPWAFESEKEFRKVRTTVLKYISGEEPIMIIRPCRIYGDGKRTWGVADDYSVSFKYKKWAVIEDKTNIMWKPQEITRAIKQGDAKIDSLFNSYTINHIKNHIYNRCFHKPCYENSKVCAERYYGQNPDCPLREILENPPHLIMFMNEEIPELIQWEIMNNIKIFYIKKYYNKIIDKPVYSLYDTESEEFYILGQH